MLTALILSAGLLIQDAAPASPTSGQVTTLPQQATAPIQSPIAPNTVDNSSRGGSAVSVDAYQRNYEGPKTDRELSFDSGIWQAYASKESQIGNLEGSWVVATADGRKLVGLELRSDHLVSGKMEGAWRSMLAGFGLNNSGFVSDVNLTGRDLEIDYFAGSARSPTILNLHKDTDGRWRGMMLDVMGHKTAVVLNPVRAAD